MDIGFDTALMQAAFQDESGEHAQEIARAWYQQIARAAFVPFSAYEVQNRLFQLARQALALLHANSFAQEEAQAIGATLVDLHFIQGEVIGKSVELLASTLTADLPPERFLALQPRLSALLGGITQGFFQQASTRILAEQESVRQANVTALNALYSERQTQQENFYEINKQLHAQVEETAQAEENLRISEEQFRTLFEDSPVALWALDASQLYLHILGLKKVGINDFRRYFSENRSELIRSIRLLVPVDVNQQAARATAATKEDLIHRPSQFLDESAVSFLLDIIVDITDNKTRGTGTVIDMSPEGEIVASVYHWSVPPVFEATFERLILSFIDITAQKKAEQQLQRTTERLEILRKLASSILQADSPQAIADIALEHMARIVPSTASAVALFRSSYAEAVMLSGRNMPLAPGNVMPAAADQVEARKRGEELLVGDIAALHEKSTAKQWVLQMKGRSLLSVPMLAQGELIGTLSLIDAKADAFTEQDVQITRQVGNSVAIAIHNARLLEKEKKARREAETLREVAANLSASLDQEELLDLILAQLERVLPFDRATILLRTKERFAITTHRGQELQIPDHFLRPGEIPRNILTVIQEQQPVIIADTGSDPDWIMYPGGEFIQCWLGVPLATKETLIGLLMLDKKEPQFYKREDAELALAFANHVAVVIENANLYKEIRQYTEILETRVAERTRELGALYDITAIASQHLELQETFDRVLSVITDAVACEAVTIQLLDDTGSKLHLAAHKNLAPQMFEYMHVLPVSNFPIREVLKSSSAIIYLNTLSMAGLTKFPLPETASHGVAAPIRVKGKNLGVLGIGYVRQDEPTREDVALITSIADHIGVAIENARLRQQSEQLAVLEERERLARDLHDSATQSLFSLMLFAGAAREHLRSGELESVQKQLIELEETAVQTHREMRLLLHELRPTNLQEKGLEEALRQRLQMVEFRSGIRGQINAVLPIKLPFSVEEVLFQVANEALNNTLKHSQADMVLINIAADSSHVNMRIRDNGRGFSTDGTDFSAGMGLDIMRQRVEEMEGTFHHESQPDAGTTVVAHIPLVPEGSTGVV